MFRYVFVSSVCFGLSGLGGLRGRRGAPRQGFFCLGSPRLRKMVSIGVLCPHGSQHWRGLGHSVGHSVGKPGVSDMSYRSPIVALSAAGRVLGATNRNL
ncbi:hypothetical protein GE09DRAFT_1097040, partial [Coniochaeta sp. 2T2.1]